MKLQYLVLPSITLGFSLIFPISQSKVGKPPQVKKLRKPGKSAEGCTVRASNGGGGRIKNIVIMISNLNKFTVICRSVHILICSSLRFVL